MEDTIRNLKKALLLIYLLLFCACIETDACIKTGEARLKYVRNINIENINGEMKVESWGGDQIRLEWKKYVPNISILDKIEVNIKEYPDKIEVKTYLPRVNSGVHGGVDYKLFLPERRMGELSLKTVNGRIEIEKLKQITRIEARTANGEIEMEDIDPGEICVDTDNGAIEIDKGE